MIDISKLTKKDRGRRVIFVLYNRQDHNGKMVSWDDKHIYVRYDNPLSIWEHRHKNETNNTTGIKTYYKWLEFEPIVEIVTRADLMDFDDD